MRSLGILSGLALSGCAAAVTLPPYVPETTAELTGSMQVNTFSYFPPAGFAANQVRNTAAGQIMLTEPVADYVTHAVRRELRQAGLSLKGSGCELDGEVSDFALDDLGYSVTYLSDIRYILHGGGETLYDNTFQVNFTGSKFTEAMVVFAGINKMLSQNVAQLLADPVFVSQLEQRCGPVA